PVALRRAAADAEQDAVLVDPDRDPGEGLAREELRPPAGPGRVGRLAEEQGGRRLDREVPPGGAEDGPGRQARHAGQDDPREAAPDGCHHQVPPGVSRALLNAAPGLHPGRDERGVPFPLPPPPSSPTNAAVKPNAPAWHLTSAGVSSSGIVVARSQ
ncbi:hypothetical protein THAOC_32633, partial [Thalassiosira oceanica]